MKAYEYKLETRENYDNTSNSLSAYQFNSDSESKAKYNEALLRAGCGLLMPLKRSWNMQSQAAETDPERLHKSLVDSLSNSDEGSEFTS